jgi:hypothetical protein
VPTRDKSDDKKHSFYEKRDWLLDEFPMHHTKILLGNFNTKVGREKIFSN